MAWQINHVEAHVVLEDVPLAPATGILATLEAIPDERFGFNRSTLQLETARGHDEQLVGD